MKALHGSDYKNLFLFPQVGTSLSMSTLQLGGLWFLLRPGLEWIVTWSVYLLSLEVCYFNIGFNTQKTDCHGAPHGFCKDKYIWRRQYFSLPVASLHHPAGNCRLLNGLSSWSPSSLGEHKTEGPGVLWHGKSEEKSLYWEWGDLGSKFSSAAYQLFNLGQV